jgi:hypothetical protein
MPGDRFLAARLEYEIPGNSGYETKRWGMDKGLKDDVNKEIQHQWATSTDVWACTGCQSLQLVLVVKVGDFLRGIAARTGLSSKSHLC